MSPVRILCPVTPEVQAAGHARLAQSAERKTLNLVVVGSSPTLGEILKYHCWYARPCFLPRLSLIFEKPAQREKHK